MPHPLALILSLLRLRRVGTLATGVGWKATQLVKKENNDAERMRFIVHCTSIGRFKDKIYEEEQRVWNSAN